MLNIELLCVGDPQRLSVESALRARAFYLPVEHTVQWLAGRAESSILAVFSERGDLVGAVPITVLRPRSMPGHVRLRAEKLGACLPVDQVGAAVEAIVGAAVARPRTLDVTIESYSRDPAVHLALENSARKLGFASGSNPHSYDRTIIVDLARSEDQLFASLHHSVRRAIRHIGRDGHLVRPVAPQLAARVDALHRETMLRTGGHYRHVDWAKNLEFSLANPTQSRISGLFVGGGQTDTELVSVRWCFAEGERMRDCFGASTRRAGLPLMHAVIWDQMRWGQGVGAAWFDFGGIPARHNRIGDSLDSIADFKRKFSQREETIGRAVTKVLRPVRSALMSAIGRAHIALKRSIRGTRSVPS